MRGKGGLKERGGKGGGGRRGHCLWSVRLLILNEATLLQKTVVTFPIAGAVFSKRNMAAFLTKGNNQARKPADTQEE